MSGDRDRLLMPDISTREELLAEMREAVGNRKPAMFVGLYPALSLVFRSSPMYREVLRSARTYPDGTGTVLSSRLHGRDVPRRMPTTDLIWDMLEVARSEQWTILLYGGKAATVAKVNQVISERFPSAKVVSARDGYQHLGAAELSSLNPDIVFVARGAPLQEIWGHDVGLSAGCPVVVTCGGLFDFMAGERRRAPASLQRLGVEWLYRIAQEPRRLLGRYVLGNTLFLKWMATSLVKGRLDRFMCARR